MFWKLSLDPSLLQGSIPSSPSLAPWELRGSSPGAAPWIPLDLLQQLQVLLLLDPDLDAAFQPGNSGVIGREESSDYGRVTPSAGQAQTEPGVSQRI
ncbi:hypothetical protein DUI87_13362 [Hirundo rustica rustica]|uniref:Uncharacterized protein n=1 Tax=Hirundo rustica rustica TaxID=333673 RepID=A0A3M0KU09_HIRRU|nr:hypothetical protein DUI87_13362 [Hirundo rustica rustica]